MCNFITVIANIKFMVLKNNFVAALTLLLVKAYFHFDLEHLLYKFYDPFQEDYIS